RKRKPPSRLPGVESDHLNGKGDGFATANAKRGNSALSAGLAQRTNQGGQQTGPGGTDGVTQGGRAAMDIHLVMRQTEVFHGCHSDDGKGFVDLVKVDVVSLPVQLGQQLLDGADRGGGEPLGLMCMLAVSDNAGQWGGTELLCCGFPH